MAEFFAMPKLGMDMEEGAIAKWLKAEGDTVEKGEPIAEIETDKSTVEVEAPTSGTVLKLLIAEGDEVPCGTPAAAIGQPGEAVTLPTQAPAAEAAAPAPEVPAAPAAEPDGNSAELFLMPKLGMDMEEGAIAKWLKAEGDKIEKGEPIAEIETDKSTVEVESPTSGTVLKLLIAEGDEVPCGTPAAAIGEPGMTIPAAAAPAPKAPETVSTPAPTAQQPAAPAPRPAAAAAAKPVSAAVVNTGRIRVSPRARRLAEKNGVDLRCVPGSSFGGRIVEQDVRDFMARPAAAQSVVRVSEETVTPLAGIRKVVAKRMSQSLSEMAQTNTRMDVDMTNMIAFRSQLNAKYAADGVKVSFVDLLIAACSKALLAHPDANASLLPDGIHRRNFVNVGVAVDTERGLVVPVLKDADILSIADISRQNRALIDKARTGALTPDDMSGGTFTISNLGMYEVDSFTAIVNPPETCILAVSRTVDRPVVVNGQIVIRPMMNLCLSYDHRVLDGAPAARFLQEIKHNIENPVWLLL